MFVIDCCRLLSSRGGLYWFCMLGIDIEDDRDVTWDIEITGRGGMSSRATTDPVSESKD